MYVFTFLAALVFMAALGPSLVMASRGYFSSWGYGFSLWWLLLPACVLYAVAHSCSYVLQLLLHTARGSSWTKD